MKILVTGAAGFIGSQLSARLMAKGHDVMGLDNYNDHLYDPKLKEARGEHFDIPILPIDIRDKMKLFTALVGYKPEVIVHLAAHAGVRDSFGKEMAYIDNNVVGTQNLIDIVRDNLPDTRVIYASTSSIYGGTPIPDDGWVEEHVEGHQLNAYANTKFTNECQFKMSGVDNVGLRFFTVYGPWGRPDMALFQFTRKILAGEPIEVFNYGDMKRDFTFVEDILDGIEIVIEDKEILPNSIFNIGCSEQVNLLDFVHAIEDTVGKKANIELKPKHPADTKETFSNTKLLQGLGYMPKVRIREGVQRFYEWYKEYYNV